MQFIVAVAGILLFITTARLSQVTIVDHNLRACSLLSFHLPEIVSFPGEQRYESGTEQYWARNQRDARASCRVSVQSSDDTQKAMFLIASTNAAFAIKSGGHSTVVNTSNVDGGVVIDLQYLNHVNVNLNSLTLDLGAGTKFSDIYGELEKSDPEVVVAGARSGSVGVGGYVLGGGLSIFSAALGWGCDQVTFFEAVLANGTLLEASRHINADLFRALKGGGSNFAVVTRLGLRLVRKPRINVVTLQYQSSAIRDLMEAVTQYNMISSEESGSAAVSIGSGGRFISISLVLTHTDVQHSDIFLPFFEIPHQMIDSTYWSQRELATYYDSMDESGFRQSRSTITIQNHSGLLGVAAQELLKRLVEFLPTLEDPYARGGLLVQPLPLSQLNVGNSTGGNMLALEDEPYPLMLLMLDVRHSILQNDAVVDNFIASFVADLERNATMLSAAHTFRYLNYASAQEDVFSHARNAQGTSFPWSMVLDTKVKYDGLNVFGRQINDPFRIYS